MPNMIKTFYQLNDEFIKNLKEEFKKTQQNPQSRGNELLGLIRITTMAIHIFSFECMTNQKDATENFKSIMENFKSIMENIMEISKKALELFKTNTPEWCWSKNSDFVGMHICIEDYITTIEEAFDLSNDNVTLAKYIAGVSIFFAEAIRLAVYMKEHDENLSVSLNVLYTQCIVYSNSYFKKKNEVEEKNGVL